MANIILNVRYLLTRQPLTFCPGAFDGCQLLLQHPGGDIAHFRAPLLPERMQMVIKALRFAPFGTVQTHDFIVRQHKLQLAPDQTALTMH